MNQTVNQKTTILLIDLECTCNNEPPLPRDEMEIIEIGAVIVSLDAHTYTRCDERQIYVQPQRHTLLTPFCTRLTGIQQQHVDQASPLVAALDELSSWLTQYRLSAWGSWGKFDQRHFETETKLKGLANPLGPLRHLNIKQLFANIHGHRLGLARAVQHAGLDFQGRLHCGLDDTRNIGRLLEHDVQLRKAIINSQQ